MEEWSPVVLYGRGVRVEGENKVFYCNGDCGIRGETYFERQCALCFKEEEEEVEGEK